MADVLPPGWSIQPLEALLTSKRDLTYGIVQPGSETIGGVPIVRVRDIRNGRVNTREPLKVAPAVEATYERSRLRGGELLVTLVGTVGEVAVAGPELVGWNVARAVAVARVRPEIGARWVTWALRLAASVNLIAERVNTTVQTTLNLADLRELPVPIPPAEQRAGIAATLGSLDDKIESNRRAIQITQHLSRLIYQRWRAQHATVIATTFGDFADVFGGATPKTTEPSYWNGGIAWATPTDITALAAPYLYRTTRAISQEGLDSTSATLHPAGTIFMTSRATIGAFAVTQLPAATNQGFIAVRPRKPEHRWFLFEEMRSRVPEMLDRANGSTFMELSRGNFKLMTLAAPDKAALHELDAELSSLHNRAAQLDRECSQLVRLRDMLLPELLSGRIRVSDAAKAIGEAVA